MRTLPLVILALACLWSAGCSGGLAEVSGTVHLDGRPIEEGAINFIPIEGTQGPASGAAIRDGKYHIPRSKGVAPGKHRVELRAFRNTGRKVQDPTGPPGARMDERVPAFGPEYNDDSKLTREVKPGSNTFDFDIATKNAGPSAPSR
jgi:hypothetical protein